MAQTPDVWGLRCPEGTGQGQRHILTGQRLRRIADIQKQCLRQPRLFVIPLCFHRHSRFVLATRRGNRLLCTDCRAICVQFVPFKKVLSFVFECFLASYPLFLCFLEISLFSFDGTMRLTFASGPSRRLPTTLCPQYVHNDRLQQAFRLVKRKEPKCKKLRSKLPRRWSARDVMGVHLTGSA